MSAVGERSIPVSDYVRNYMQLLPWWSTREGIIEDFRRWQREGAARHVMVPRVHHDEIVKAATTGATITVLVDLQPKDPFLILGVMRNVAYGGGLVCLALLLLINSSFGSWRFSYLPFTTSKRKPYASLIRLLCSPPLLPPRWDLTRR
jgi:hypothetical protein